MLKFSDKAKEKIQSFIKQSNQNEMALRVSFQKTFEKASQYYFGLEPLHNKKPNDHVIAHDGFTTFLDPVTFSKLEGLTVDWILKNGKEGFKVVEQEELQGDHLTTEFMKQKIVDGLKEIFDPEIPVNIYDLGLIYNIEVQNLQAVVVTMTLTAANCPAAEQLPIDVKTKVKAVSGIDAVEVNLTWEPAWTPEKMSEVARLELNMPLN